MSFVEQDFDLHGLVTVRVVDATPDDILKVRRQLGLVPTKPSGDADISIRFVDVATTKPLTYVRLHECGFNEEGFFVLRGRGTVHAKARLPLDQVGRHPEIVCERAMPAVPHLLAVLNMTALTKDVLPLHASAFTCGPTGVLVTGWAKGGKTESLLAAMNTGARYVGDEWVYLAGERRMFGLPEPIRLWGWQLRQFPEVLRPRSMTDRVRVALWDRAAAVIEGIGETRLPGGSACRKAAPVLRRQAYLQIPPATLFGADAIELEGTADVLLFLASHEAAEIVVKPMPAQEIAARMSASLLDERAALLDHYAQFRYAFPERKSTVIEGAEAVEARLLADYLHDLPALSVIHPYPCDIAALGTVVRNAASRATAGHQTRPD